MDKKINALDLFAGAGGMSTGMESAGINVVVAIEYIKQISETYKYNHPSTKMICGDIRCIKASDADDTFSEFQSVDSIFKKQGITCDIIFGGPPCQGFSMAGNRIRNKTAFLDDPRNMLFKEYVRMVEFIKPKVFVIENVPGILNYNDGAIYKEIIDLFYSLGYNVDAKILCAADYGVPQMRHRAVFIGNNIGFNSNELFPTKSVTEYITIKDAIMDLPSINACEGYEPMKYTMPPFSEYQKLMRNGCEEFYNHISSYHKPETIKILEMIHQGQTMKDLPEQYHTKSVHSGAYGRMNENEPSYTLTTRLNTPSVGRITHPILNRTITPREAARLQSFPDSYRFLGDITSLGIQIGNAVPPLLAKAIGEQIINKVF